MNKRIITITAIICALLFAASCSVKNKTGKDAQAVATDIPNSTEQASASIEATPAPFETEIVTFVPGDISASPYPSGTVFESPVVSIAPTAYASELPTTPAPSVPAATFTPAPTGAASETPIPATAQPTAVPTAAPTTPPTTAPTAAPTTSPTSQPQTGEITFSESSSLPLPSMNENLPHGQPFCFGGKVKCSSPILSVKAVISTDSGFSKATAVTFSASDNKTTVELVDPTFPSSGDQSLTKKTKFEELPAGTYRFSLYASAVGVPEKLIKSSSFKIVKSEWNTLISNHLRNNYAYALSFFGSRDEFLFRYKWEDGRQITVEQSWLNSHIGNVTSPAGKKWYVHKKAVPKYQKAIDYMNSTYIRVRGASDSGVIKLWDLVKTFDGTLNTRFVSERTFVSHHAFGTAIDLNASMDANLNRLENRTLIKNEVINNLTYNGIKTANGVSYYDFTYSGSHSSKHKNVPTTVINYLLYELAFYRAGFGWGYYYTHACDAMHFSVSELSPELHDASSRALRKVYSYVQP